ncbi:MAG: phage integrase N-terminal SAM-like domain-containing protein [Turicibacter sp.]|nr:phage integrase N-terminal SAM-like domain-containing protein [Turicibacter sp.]
MHLENIMQEFEFHLQTKNYSSRTIKSYRNNNKKFITYLLANNVVTLHQVNPTHIKSYLNQLITLGRQATYCNTILKSVRAFFNYCLEEEYIMNNQYYYAQAMLRGDLDIYSLSRLLGELVTKKKEC